MQMMHGYTAVTAYGRRRSRHFGQATGIINNLGHRSSLLMKLGSPLSPPWQSPFFLRLLALLWIAEVLQGADCTSPIVGCVAWSEWESITISHYVASYEQAQGMCDGNYALLWTNHHAKCISWSPFSYQLDRCVSCDGSDLCCACNSSALSLGPDLDGPSHTLPLLLVPFGQSGPGGTTTPASTTPACLQSGDCARATPSSSTSSTSSSSSSSNMLHGSNGSSSTSTSGSSSSSSSSSSTSSNSSTSSSSTSSITVEAATPTVSTSSSSFQWSVDLGLVLGCGSWSLWNTSAEKNENHMNESSVGGLISQFHELSPWTEAQEACAGDFAVLAGGQVQCLTQIPEDELISNFSSELCIFCNDTDGPYCCGCLMDALNETMTNVTQATRYWPLILLPSLSPANSPQTSSSTTSLLAEGFLAEFFELDATPNKLQELHGLTPNLVRVDEQVSFKTSWRNAVYLDIGDENFAARWSGYLRITAAGIYDFWIISDDGSRLSIGRHELAVNNDGLHPMEERAARARLQNATYALSMEYFQARQGAGVSLEYRGPDTDFNRVVVPGSAMTPALVSYTAAEWQEHFSNFIALTTLSTSTSQSSPLTTSTRTSSMTTSSSHLTTSTMTSPPSTSSSHVTASTMTSSLSTSSTHSMTFSSSSSFLAPNPTTSTHRPEPEIEQNSSSTQMMSTSTSSSSPSSSSSSTDRSPVTAVTSPEVLLGRIKVAETTLLLEMLRDGQNQTTASIEGAVMIAAVLDLDAIGTGNGEAVLDVEDSHVEVRFPVEALQKVGGLAVAVVTAFDPGTEASFATSSSTLAGAPVSIRLVDPGNLATYSVSGLTNTVKIRVLAGQSQELATSPSCAYWDEEKARWLEDGVRAVVSPGMTSSGFICESNHLTLFAAIWRTLSSPISCNNAEVFTAQAMERLGGDRWWLSGAACFLWMLLIFELVIYGMIQYKSRQVERSVGWCDDHLFTSNPAYQEEERQESLPAWLASSVREGVESLQLKEAPVKAAEACAHYALAREQRVCAEDLAIILVGTPIPPPARDDDVEAPEGQPVPLVQQKTSEKTSVTLAVGEESPVAFTEGSCSTPLLFVHVAERADRVVQGFFASPFRHQVWILFTSMNAWIAVDQFSFSLPAATRALLLIAKVQGSLFVSALFFLSTGDAFTRDSDTDCDLKSVWENLGRNCGISVCSTFLGTFPYLIMARLGRRKLVYDRCWEADKRHRYRKWWQLENNLLLMFVCAYNIFCVVMVAVFIANIDAKTEADWVSSAIMDLFLEILIFPFLIALLIVLLATCAAHTKTDILDVVLWRLKPAHGKDRPQTYQVMSESTTTRSTVTESWVEVTGSSEGASPVTALREGAQVKEGWQETAAPPALAERPPRQESASSPIHDKDHNLILEDASGTASSSPGQIQAVPSTAVVSPKGSLEPLPGTIADVGRGNGPATTEVQSSWKLEAFETS